MMRFPFVCIMSMTIMSLFTACENYDEDDYKCTCIHGGFIEGWEDSDTTDVTNGADTVRGFDITLSDWMDIEIHNIELN